MQHISSYDRHQLFFGSLEEQILANDPVRFLDAFVDKLNLVKLGFVVKEIQVEGRPSFEPKLFLKIYLYGYQNGIRSSRRLEKECRRNIEMQWLCGKLAPNYHSIADFRKLNGKALQNMFKLFVSFLREADLVGGKTIAIDGTKSRAHNGKKNNYTARKLDRHFKYIEEKTVEYLHQMDELDQHEDAVTIADIESKLDRLNKKSN